MKMCLTVDHVKALKEDGVEYPSQVCLDVNLAGLSKEEREFLNDIIERNYDRPLLLRHPTLESFQQEFKNHLPRWRKQQVRKGGILSKFLSNFCAAESGDVP